MRSNSRRPAIGLAQAALLSAAAFLGTGSALAQSDTGRLKFNNARMENAAPQDVITRMPASGMRAYIDPATGELRDQTPEEALGAGMKSKSSSGAASTKSVAVSSPMGGFIAELDESFMLNAVATRDASGRVKMHCIPGGSLASVLRNTAKEHNHAH